MTDASVATRSRFPIRFDAWFRAFSFILFAPGLEGVRRRRPGPGPCPDGLDIPHAFPRSSVQATSLYDKACLSRGVHGFAGRWLVNGSGDGIVIIDIHPAARARVLGFPVRLRQLMVSVSDPHGLATRLHPR